jgi:hypothetical protein
MPVHIIRNPETGSHVRGRRITGRFLAGLFVLGTCLGVPAQETTAQFILVPDARSGDATAWRFTTDDPGNGWTGAEYDHASWQAGFGGFGTGAAQGNAVITTDWTTPDIWLRKTFTVEALDFEYMILRIQHDEDVEVFLNGTEILTESFTNGAFTSLYLNDAAKSAMKTGDNIFAIHCRNLDGPGYIDAGLAVTRLVQARPLVNDARNGGEDWKWTDAGTGAGWNGLGYDDADWNLGHSGFGSADFAAIKNTDWTGYDIWLRKSFTVDRDFNDYLLSYLHDDEMELYLNGNQVLQESGSGTEYKELTLSAAKLNIVKGENVLAVRCTNSGGGPQFIDAGLVGLERNNPVAIRRARTARGRAAADRAPVLYAGRETAGRETALDLSGLKTATGARLEVFGVDGALRATLRPEGRSSVDLPTALGAGTFRYRWVSGSSQVQGILIRLH